MTGERGAGTDVDGQRRALEAWVARRGEHATFGETHVSILAFGRDRVWKLKKAVTFPFVDLSTPELRRADCERELRLNRRIAPDVYLGVVAVDDAEGTVVDHLVEMRRMPADRSLAALAARGADVDACIDRLAADLARFHAAAATGGAIDDASRRDAVAALWKANVEEMGRFAGRTLDGALLEGEALDGVARAAERYLSGREALFDARVRAGCSRDGHGDLLADDVFCLADGPRALDCLEFDDRLRYGDVLADVAFLAMDLEHLARADLATRLLGAYRTASGRDWPASLEHHWIAYRALVRSKIACLRAGADSQAVPVARGLLELTRRHLHAGRVRVVLVGGSPATGKTTLATALGARRGWPVVHSDELRKKLAGLEPGTRRAAALDAGLYTSEWTERVYATIARRARECLELGTCVVLDASWSDPRRRAEIAAVARLAAADLVALQTVVPPEIARRRADERAATGTDASDVAGALVAPLASRFAVWPEAEAIDMTDADDAVERAGAITDAG